MANKICDKDDIKKATKQVAFEVLISARCSLWFFLNTDANIFIQWALGIRSWTLSRALKLA